MRLSAKAPIVIRGDEITHLDADGYRHLPRATALPDGKVLATSGGKWAPGDLSGISVSSVFGRTGAVAAQAGDYTAAQVGAEPYAGAPAATSFWRSTAAGVRAWVQLVASDITDLATTLAAYLTKNNPTFTGRLSGSDVKIGSASSGGWLQLSTNNTGSGAFSVDFLGGTESKRRMTLRWSDTADYFLIMSSADDGSARQDRLIIPRDSSLPISVGGGLKTTEQVTANGATAQAWGTGYKPVAIGLGSSIAAKNWPAGDTVYIFNNAWRATGDVTKAISGTGNCSALMLQENGGLSFSTVANPGAGATASLVEKFSVDATGVLWLNGTTRITAGGDGRFASLRASGLAASSTYLTRLDANGELIASSIKEDLGDLGGASGQRTVFERPIRFATAGGAWGGSSYTSWTPSAYLPISDDSQGNDIANLRSGWIWNSQRLNALTITDGANATPYRGRVKADRWVAYSTLIIQNTTAAASWFAAGSGDGSPTIPANYLKAGRRVRVEGRVFCPSCAANTAPEIVLKVGAATLWTRSKAFTIAAGNEIFIDVRANIFIDDENRLIVVGDVEFSAVATGVYNFKQGGQIDPYNGTIANTIDVTVKPSSTSETWVRSFAFIEA